MWHEKGRREEPWRVCRLRSLEGFVNQSGLFREMVVGGRSEHFVGARELSAIHHNIFT